MRVVVDFTPPRHTSNAARRDLFLRRCSSFGKTAFHLLAERGDLKKFAGLHTPHTAPLSTPDGTLIGKIHLPESCANLCFGGVKRNRLFMAASQSLYSLYVAASPSPDNEGRSRIAAATPQGPTFRDHESRTLHTTKRLIDDGLHAQHCRRIRFPALARSSSSGLSRVRQELA